MPLHIEDEFFTLQDVHRDVGIERRVGVEIEITARDPCQRVDFVECDECARRAAGRDQESPPVEPGASSVSRGVFECEC